MSFDTAGKTMMGITPANFAKRAQELVVGMNAFYRRYVNC